MALDETLDSLSSINPAKGRMVESPLLRGLTIDESAGVLKILSETAKRHWKMAKAWLGVQLTGNSE